MPTTYTHDLFGKKVYRELPKEMKEVIKENKDLYRIGLHGPDIFFYQLLKGRVNRAGVQMHKESAHTFFEEGMAKCREQENRPLIAYLLGFGCHYLLDSACHPYVDEMVQKKVITHTLLEKDWDRDLMTKNGKNPLTSRPADALVPKKEYAKVIHQVVPAISEKEIYESLYMQKFLLNRMVHGKYGILQKLVEAVLSKSAKEDVRELAEHFMKKEASKASEDPIQKLNELFDKTLAEAPGYLEELYALTRVDKQLSRRWDQTYNG